MRTWTSLAVVGALLMTALPAQATADWSQFRPSPGWTTREDVLAAMHAFDPSLDLSQVWIVPIAFEGPASSVLVKADMLTGRITGEALTDSVLNVLAPQPDHGGQPAGCVLGPLGFGYASNPPGVGLPGGLGTCPFTPHTDGVDNIVLACAIVQFCYTFGYQSLVSFSYIQLYCTIPGGVASTAAPIAPPCFAFGFGAPPATWTLWQAYGGNTGLLAAFAWAH